MPPNARYNSDNVDASPLGQPLDFVFSGKTAPNRFLKAAMTERISSWHPKDYEARGGSLQELDQCLQKMG